MQYYYNQPASGSNNNFVSNLLGSLFQALSAGPANSILKGAEGNVTNNLNVNTGFVNAVQPSSNTGTTPLAYLTILFFDERFNFISVTDGGAYQQQVASSVGSNGSSLILTGIKAPKNGYVYAYISNQSDQNVYFDNFAFTISQGNIIEENHYYSFGLKIAAISSKKFADSYDGDTKNNYQMQGAFSEMDEDIGWNDFALRNYDPQIGRWMQQDPYQEFPSPYTGMGNDPVNNVDPSGGNIFGGMSAVGRAAVTTLAGAIVGLGGSLISGDDSFKGALIGAAAGLGGSVLNISIVTRLVVNASTTILNTSVVTRQVGSALADGGKKSNPLKDLWKDITDDYIDDPDKLKVIQRALNNAMTLVDERLIAIFAWDQDEKDRMLKIYGRNDDIARDILITRLGNLNRALSKFFKDDQYKKQFFDGGADQFAHVYSYDSDFEIYLDNLFWDDKMLPQELGSGDYGTKAGTILHELSHFSRIGKTKDEKLASGRTGYGLKNALQLAIESPNKALNSANNFKFYMVGGF